MPLIQLVIDNIQQQKEIESLRYYLISVIKEKNKYIDKYKILKNHIKYSPGGEGYKKTKAHFYSLIDK
jgi:hypothetical protein